MNRNVTLVALAVTLLAGCATTATYTNPAKGNDPQAMQSALDKCDKQADAKCSPRGDSYNYCLKMRTKECMESEGWTEK